MPDQSELPAPRATPVRKWSWTRLATGIGAAIASAAASARRISFNPSAILKPAGSYCSFAMIAP